MNRLLTLTLTLILTLFYSCTIDDPDNVFFDYKIMGNEEDSLVTVHLQYRMGGPYGRSFSLNEPGKVVLDEEQIPKDSAGLSGVFYEIQKPLQSFTGKHMIVYTADNKKEYKEEFIFQPFKLRTNLAAVVNRGDLVFEFSGLETGDPLTVIATDTGFTSEDIHLIDTVKNGRIIISEFALENLVNGPIYIMFYNEQVKRVKNGTERGGRITISYGLQREFELQD